MKIAVYRIKCENTLDTLKTQWKSSLIEIDRIRKSVGFILKVSRIKGFCSGLLIGECIYRHISKCFLSFKLLLLHVTGPKELGMEKPVQNRVMKRICFVNHLDLFSLLHMSCVTFIQNLITTFLFFSGFFDYSDLQDSNGPC